MTPANNDLYSVAVEAFPSLDCGMTTLTYSFPASGESQSIATFASAIGAAR